METQRDQYEKFNLKSPLYTNSIGRVMDSASLDSSQSSSRLVWERILDIPGVRSWKILRDVAFLLTSFPLALAAFIVAIVGGALGLSLSWLLIGIPILVWTVGFVLRFAAIERERFGTLLDLNLGVPNYPANNGENVFKHLWSVLRSKQVRSDLVYMALLFPVGIVELIIVLLPLEFFVPSLLHLGLGSLVSADVFGMAISSRFEALVFLGLGVVMLAPMLILMNIAVNLHATVARKFLKRQR